MSEQPLPPGSTKPVGRGIYITTKATGYQEEDLQDEMLWAEFRDNFRDWTITDFNECPSMTLRKFRQLLHQRGVWVGSHPEIPPAQSLYDVIKEERQTKWSESDIQDFIDDGGRFISDGITYFMLEHGMPTLPELPQQLRVSSPSITFTRPPSPLYPVLPALPQRGTPSPTPTALPGITKHPLNIPQPTATQGHSNDAQIANPPPTTDQLNNMYNDNIRNEPLNHHGLKDGPGNNLRQNDYRSGNRGNFEVGRNRGNSEDEQNRGNFGDGQHRGNFEDGPREGPRGGTGHGFGNCLATLEKIYKDDCKYSGRKDNFEHKLGIFFDLCLKANVPPEAQKAAYSTMLRGPALDHYHTNLRHRVQTARFEDLCGTTKKYFEGREYQRGLINRWNSITLGTVMNKPENTGKTTSECLQLLRLSNHTQ
jgi:hypothetical protein